MTKPTVLVLASERVIFEIRLKPLLEELVSSGTLSSFTDVDRDFVTMGSAPSRFFNSVIAQRNISTLQWRFLKRTAVPFIYDIDDLLTELPAHRNRNIKASNERISWCLTNARTVTTPNRKLAEELARSTGAGFLDRNHIVANGLAPPLLKGPMPQGPADSLLWVSSDLPLVETETPGLVQVIAETVNELRLRPILVGRFSGLVKHAFHDCEQIASLDFPSYRQFLARREKTIAIAPLPVYSRDHQAFVDCKSDIKVVDFLGHAIPAVYSDAYPYRNTDLRPRPLIGGDLRAWKAAIRELAKQPEHFISCDEVAQVHERRSYGTLANVMGRLIEDAVGPARPWPRPSLNAKLRAIEHRLRRWRRRA